MYWPFPALPGARSSHCPLTVYIHLSSSARRAVLPLTSVHRSCMYLPLSTHWERRSSYQPLYTHVIYIYLFPARRSACMVFPSKSVYIYLFQTVKTQRLVIQHCTLTFYIFPIQPARSSHPALYIFICLDHQGARSSHPAQYIFIFPDHQGTRSSHWPLYADVLYIFTFSSASRRAVFPSSSVRWCWAIWSVCCSRRDFSLNWTRVACNLSSKSATW